MENYAGFMAYTDHRVGRLIDSLASSGRAGQYAGHLHRRRQRCQCRRRAGGHVQRLPACWGCNWDCRARSSGSTRSAGRQRAACSGRLGLGHDAPFQWTKQVASHFGGTRNPLVIHWPKGIKAKGETRTQFHHVIDVVPTILEACKIPEPKIVNGIPEADRRVSMLYTFEDAKAKDRRTTQYFEMATIARSTTTAGWRAAGTACPGIRPGARTTS